MGMVTLALALQPEAAIDAQYASLFTELTRLCRAVGAGDEAQDVAQEVLLYGRAHVGELRDPGKLRPWLRKIAVRAVVRQRSRARVTSLEGGEIAYLPAESELGLDALAAIAALPERERVAVTLTYGLGYEQHEVADMMGIRRGTVASSLWRARQKLARALAPAMEGQRR